MIENRWKDEEAWWTLGAAEARRRTHPAAVMVFSIGVLQGETIFAAMEGVPRWDSVAMSDRHVVETEGCVTLAYRASAMAADRRAEVLCSSTWVRLAEGWRLVQHQQTPVDGPGTR